MTDTAGAELPPGKFSTICADPPWHFRTRSETRQNRAAKNHYSIMSLDDIKDMPVTELAAPDCVLLLWATNPMLPQALSVMESWGFQFKTVGFCWAKTSRSTSPAWTPKYHMGLGYWTRQNVELCLLGVRGKPQRVSKAVRQLIVEPVREHSRKPERFFRDVEQLLPGPYLELFSRQSRPGWTTWGSEKTKFDKDIQLETPRISQNP